MLTLYHREECQFCARVRRFLEDQHLQYEAIPVPKLAGERTALTALPGVELAEVPVLVDGDTVIGGSDLILEHLEEHHRKSAFGDPPYGLTRKLHGVGFADAIPLVKDALATVGFGVLTEIDVKATLKKKLDVDHRPYLILGACNPPIAHQALTAEPGIGLLLPCNVVVAEDDDGSAVVSAIDPKKMFMVLDRPDIEPMAKQVGDLLRKALAAIAVD